MTPIRVFAAVLAGVALLVPGSAGAAIEPGQQIVVAYHLRATGQDAVTACQNRPFGADATPFLDGLATALHVNGRPVPGDGGDACVAIQASGPLTRRGAGGARILEIDTAGLRELIEALGYREATLVVCTPLLTDRVRVVEGAEPAPAHGCQFGGYAWNALEPLDAVVTFHASASDVVRGLAAGASWFLSLLTLSTIAAMLWGRRYHWRFLRRFEIAGFIVVTWAALVAVFAWTRVAYYSHLVHALQLRANVGTTGEVALLAVPGLVSVALVVGAALRIARDAARTYPLDAAPAVAAPSGVDAEITILPYASPPRPASSLLLASAPAAALFAAYMLFAVYLGSLEIKVEGMLATILAYAFVAPAFASGILPHVYGAKPMERPRSERIADAAQRIGSRVRSVWVTPVPPAAFPLGGALLRVGRRVFVWEPLTRLSDEELAAAVALRSARKRAWPSALGAALFTIGLTLPLREGGDLPLVVVFVPVLVLIATGLADVMETIRVRARAGAGGLGASHVRGVLVAGRETARLAASGSLGPAEVRQPNLAASIWERAVRLAEEIAGNAGLAAGSVEKAGAELRAQEMRLVMPHAPAETAQKSPDEPEPARPAQARKRVPKKKPGAPKKKAAAATRRSPARSARRPRP